MIIFNNHLLKILDRIRNLPQKQQYIIILQVTEDLLSEIIPFKFSLEKQLDNNRIQIYLLCDTNKSPCCTDIIGALHLGTYDLLVHFGEACFSQEINQKHLYCYEEPRETINYQELRKYIKEQEIDTLMVHQSLIYEIQKQLKDEEVQILKLPPDSQNLKYFALGYHMSKTPQSVLMIGFKQEEQQKMSLIKRSLNIQLYTARTYSQVAVPMKNLMRRLYLINKIKQFSTFGILVKNANTKYCQRSIEFCKQILSANEKKSYMFMMNNLNQIKLANFPEIEVYVIISCQNCVLYNQSDMHKLVVTPFDLGLALSQKTMEYQFDLHHLDIQHYLTEEMKQFIEQQKKTQPLETSLMKQQNQLEVKKIFQTLQYYKQRQYKGIDYSFQKQIKKMSKGKIGLAQEYHKIE